MNRGAWQVTVHGVQSQTRLSDFYFPGKLTAVFLPCSLMAEGVGEPCGVSFIRASIPSIKAPSSWPKWSHSVVSSSLWPLWTVAYQDSPFTGFSRQEYWGGLPFPSPGDLPNPGIEPGSPALQADALPAEPPAKSKDSSQRLHCLIPPPWTLGFECIYFEGTETFGPEQHPS